MNRICGGLLLCFLAQPLAVLLQKAFEFTLGNCDVEWRLIYKDSEANSIEIQSLGSQAARLEPPKNSK